MDTIDVKRPILIKVIMTPEFREMLMKEAADTLLRVDSNLKTLEGEGSTFLSGLGLSDPERVKEMQSRMELDRERLHQMRSELSWKMKEVENVEDGMELPFRLIEGKATLKVGDDILQKTSNAEIVVKNWKIIEIRNA